MNFGKIGEYKGLELLAKQLVEGFITGLHKSPYHGFSVEFAEHKLYNTGESTRHIDWKIYAKTNRLYTKRYEEETNLRAMLLIDNSSSMYYPEGNKAKIRLAIMGTAALAYILQRQRDAVGLCTFSEDIEFISPIKSTATHIHHLFVYLEKMLDLVPTNKKTNVAKIIHQIAERTHKRALIIIFSDIMENTRKQDELFSALQHLKHNKHEVLLFHIHDPATELALDFKDRPTVFVDLETGQKEKLQPNQVKAYYQAGIRKHFNEIMLKCGQFKIDFIKADCHKNINQILQPYLIKRGKMR